MHLALVEPFHRSSARRYQPVLQKEQAVGLDVVALYHSKQPEGPDGVSEDVLLRKSYKQKDC
jgi:hypothetical protein